ncbi:MAG: HsdM family class I SAM-dependent methyltransferase, partial [Ferrimicrobium acidiphilum]
MILRSMGNNERKTEKIVRNHFAADQFPELIIDEQSSGDRRINRALAKASKSGGGIGRPEFIITAPSLPNLVILVECKASATRHESKNGGRPKDFAVDGVLHYSNHVSAVRDVVAIAVSGQTEKDLRISTYIQVKGTPRAVALKDKRGTISRLVNVNHLVEAVQFDPSKREASLAELLAFSRTLHDDMRKAAKLIDQEKALVVSGILIGLTDKSFNLSYQALGADEIADRLVEAIKRELVRAAMPHAKVDRIVQPYSFIAAHDWLNLIPNGQSLSPLQSYCAELAENVMPYINLYGEEDVVGRFYAEFLRYSGDQKSLGIVLTPKHIAELFCDLVDLSVNDVALDPCAGTAGFLIAAMNSMDAKATAEAQSRSIREQQLIGIESQVMMFALAAANMLLRGDGKSNLYHRNSLDKATQADVTSGSSHPRPTKGMVNPPYAQTGDGFHELDF